MGQEPNIRLGLEDLPRATPKPAAPRRWEPNRPGEVGSPAEMPWGGQFGTPGPDTGFALRFVGARELPGGPEHRADVEAAVVTVVAARASAAGRAPTPSDVDVAIELLGLSDEGGLRALRGLAHDSKRLRTIVAEIPRESLIR